MPTVFLSSTYRDLVDHRAAVTNAINGIDGYRCIGMEQFGSRDAQAADFCRAQVEKCDLFVGLVGHTYGSIDPATGKSYTELEIDLACDLNKPRLMFLLREDAPIPLALVEMDEHRARQATLRQRISAERIRDTFTSPTDLAERVGRAIYNWAQTSRERADALRPLPPQSSFEHPYPIQENFTGRHQERTMMTDWFTSDNRPVLCVTAIGGMGKSALTWAWLQNDVLGLPLPGATFEARATPASTLGVHVRPQGVFWWSFYEGESSFDSFLDSALYYVGHGRDFRTEAESDDNKVRLLVRLLQASRFLIVMDGFERQLRVYATLNSAYVGDDISDQDRELIDPGAKLFFRHFLAVPGGSRLLMTSRLLPFELEGIAGCRREVLSALTPEDSESFLRAQGVSGAEVEIRSACDRVGYHPLALRLLAGLITHDPQAPGDIRAAPEYEAGVLGDQLKSRQHHVLELAYNALAEPESRLLSQIAAFRFPVSYEALERTLCVADEREGVEGKRHILRKLMRLYREDRRWHVRKDLRRRLRRLTLRGLVFLDRERQRYDLHPIVRHYAYDRLTDKWGVHARARDYYAPLPNSQPLRARSIDDFAPAIELYHHTLRAGLWPQGFRLFIERIQGPLLKHLCAAETYSMLVDALFPDGNEVPCGLDGKDKIVALGCLAHSRRLMGRPREAVSLYEKVIGEYEHLRESKSVLITRMQQGMAEMLLGRLRDAEGHLNLAIRAGAAIGETEYQPLARETLANLLLIENRDEDLQGVLDSLQGFRLSYNRAELSALRAWWGRDLEAALGFARRAAEIADNDEYEMDRIRAKCLLGTVISAAAQSGTPQRDEMLREAEDLLKHARALCVRIRFIELEVDVDLAYARWFAACGHLDEARECGAEALALARKCEYRLKQAEIHLALAEFSEAASDHLEARAHLDKANEAAACDGGPAQHQRVIERASDLDPGRSGAARFAG